jgi:hypothetical protein
MSEGQLDGIDVRRDALFLGTLQFDEHAKPLYAASAVRRSSIILQLSATANSLLAT